LLGARATAARVRSCHYALERRRRAPGRPDRGVRERPASCRKEPASRNRSCGFSHGRQPYMLPRERASGASQGEASEDRPLFYRPVSSLSMAGWLESWRGGCGRRRYGTGVRGTARPIARPAAAVQGRNLLERQVLDGRHVLPRIARPNADERAGTGAAEAPAHAGEYCGDQEYGVGSGEGAGVVPGTAVWAVCQHALVWPLRHGTGRHCPGDGLVNGARHSATVCGPTQGATTKPRRHGCWRGLVEQRAGDGIRTHDPQLGRLML
jgi:hypothetical protein